MSARLYSNQVHVRELVEALRSGDYEQGTGRLTTALDGGEFDCCLGVGCKLAIAAGIELKVTRNSEPGRAVVFYGVDNHFMPPTVADHFGLRSDPVLLFERDGRLFKSQASSANDTGASFEQIAAAFEFTYLDEAEPIYDSELEAMPEVGDFDSFVEYGDGGLT